MAQNQGEMSILFSLSKRQLAVHSVNSNPAYYGFLGKYLNSSPVLKVPLGR